MLLLALAPAALAAPPAAPTVLHLMQTAARKVPRDRLTIDLETEATGSDPRRVQAEVNRRMAAALGKAKSVPSVHAASGSYDTYRFAPTAADGKPTVPEQWRAVQDLTLSSGDFAAALALAGTLQADGLAIVNMQFGVAPETLRAQEDALTREALAGITARAAQIASALGLKVAGIRDLTVGNAQTEGGPVLPMAMARRGGAAAPPPAVAAGDSTVVVSVQADILLAPTP